MDCLINFGHVKQKIWFKNTTASILRTHLKFCYIFKYKKKDVTPAMLLGIADEPFTLEDIIYFK
jgi:hypothetical protein